MSIVIFTREEVESIRQWRGFTYLCFNDIVINGLACT